VRGSGGALAVTVTSPDELMGALAEGTAAACSTGAVDNGTAFVLESLLVGAGWHQPPGFAPYVSVESAAVDGRYVHLAVTDRFPLAPPALETGMMLPSALPDHYQKRIVAMADAALRALEFRHGMAHTEVMLTREGPVVIEVNARVGGAIPYLFPMACGVDLVELAGEVALGRLRETSLNFEGHAVFIGPQHPVGVEVKSVEGLDAARALPGVQTVIPLTKPGTRTDGFKDTMAAAVLAKVATPEEATILWTKVMSTVHGDYSGEPRPAYIQRTPAQALATGAVDPGFATSHRSLTEAGRRS